MRDFRTEDKNLYLPSTQPAIVDVGPIPFIMIDGHGDPNEPTSAYQAAVELLYALSYAIKMNKQKDIVIKDYYDYTVYPLEGLWSFEEGKPQATPIDKSKFVWTMMIRQPEFVNEEVFQWACETVLRKKKLNTDKAYLKVYDEGLCVQCLHVGSFDTEPLTIDKIMQFIISNHLIDDISDKRRHHEIYLSDPRRVATDRLKTILRIPVRREY